MFEFLRRSSSGNVPRLAGISLFSGLTNNDLRKLESFTHFRHFLPGEIVFDRGEEAQALYAILSGRVIICHPGEAEMPIAELGAGSFFGELALLDDSPRSAQARAAVDTELAAFSRGDFERLLDSHSRIAFSIALQLARNLGQRLREAIHTRQGQELV